MDDLGAVRFPQDFSCKNFHTRILLRSLAKNCIPCKTFCSINNKSCKNKRKVLCALHKSNSLLKSVFFFASAPSYASLNASNVTFRKMSGMYDKVVGVISKEPGDREDREVKELLPWFCKKSDLFAEIKPGVNVRLIDLDCRPRKNLEQDKRDPDGDVFGKDFFWVYWLWPMVIEVLSDASCGRQESLLRSRSGLKQMVCAPQCTLP